MIFPPGARGDPRDGSCIRAAEIFRTLRRKGITVRKPVDCMIASAAIEHNVPLLHHDRDFDPIERHCGLKTIRVG